MNAISLNDFEHAFIPHLLFPCSPHARVSGKATMAFNGKISSQMGKNAAPAC
jgi:hypothetical protein